MIPFGIDGTGMFDCLRYQEGTLFSREFFLANPKFPAIVLAAKESDFPVHNGSEQNP